MSTIQNDRDVLLQAAAIRVVPVVIQIGDVAGLGDALKRIEITSSAPSFVGASGTPTPISITLTAHLKNGLSGAVTWAVVAGSASITPSGLNCTVSGSSVAGTSVTIRASVADNGTTHTAQIVLARYGALSAADQVSLTTQVTGQLSSGNVTGLGALALLNKVDLNTQTVGALNGSTQVTNLGTLAYVNAIAANQIGAGTLAAGVIYAGSINADNITSGTVTGRTIRTATSGTRAELYSNGTNAHSLIFYTGIDTQYSIRIAPGQTSSISGNLPSEFIFTASNIGGGSTGGGLRGTSSSDGVGVYGISNSGAAVAGRATGASGIGGVFESVNGPALRLNPRAAVPTLRTAGAFCVVGGKPCFADGTHWWELTLGTRLT